MGDEGPSIFLRRRRRKTVALSVDLVLIAAAVVVAVTRPEITSAANGKTRTYFIAADPVDWDYAPGGQRLGPHFDADAGTFLDNGDDRIGKVNRKSMYRAYTDESFKTLAPVPEEWK